MKTTPRARSISLKEALLSATQLSDESRALFEMRTIEEFDRLYKKEQIIGEGATGVVYLGSSRQSGDRVAIKIICDRILIHNINIIREVSVLRSLSHPNIIKLIDVFLTHDRLLIVMELASGPELFDAICEKRNYSEDDAAKVRFLLC
jgi:serine/threonine protein kinase